MKAGIEAKQEDTLQLLNEYLKILKRKLALTTQVLSSFVVQSESDSKYQQYFSVYDQCKANQCGVLEKLHKARMVSAAEKRTFDRFCLRIYQQFESASQKITKARLTSADPSQLTLTLQGIFGEFKSSQRDVDLGQFLFQIVDLQENFKLRSLRKIFNQAKKIDLIVADSCKALFKLEVALKLKYDQEYDSWVSSSPGETNFIQPVILDSRRSIGTTAESSENRGSLATLSASNSFVKKKESIPIRHTKIVAPYQIKSAPEVKVCEHCQFLKLLDPANMEDINHTTQQTSEKVLQILHNLNQKNTKMIDQWRRISRKANKLQVPSSPVFVQYPTTDQDIKTFSVKSTIERKRVSGTRSVIMAKDNKQDDHKRGNSLMKISEKLRRPSLAKLTQKRHELQMLRDLDQKDKIFYSFNGEQVFQRSRELDINDVIKKEQRESIALPRISRR